MAYGLIRVRNLHSNQIAKVDVHNARRYEEVGETLPENIKSNGYAAKFGQNEHTNSTGCETIQEAINKRITEAEVKLKSNSVVAQEIVVSASKEFFEKMYQQNQAIEEFQRDRECIINHLKKNPADKPTGVDKYFLTNGEIVEKVDKMASAGEKGENIYRVCSNNAKTEIYLKNIGGNKEKLNINTEKKDASEFLRQCVNDFIGKKYGNENIVSTSLHFDETNPHAHVIIVPIVKKEVKWKNRNGEGTKVENRLCARDYCGKVNLRKLQQEFYEFCKPIGQKIGVEFYRGTLAEEQKKIYTQKTDHSIGELRIKITEATNELEKMKLTEELSKLQKEFNQKTNEFNEKREKHEKKNHGVNWQKGFNNDKGF